MTEFGDDGMDVIDLSGDYTIVTVASDATSMNHKVMPQCLKRLYNKSQMTMAMQYYHCAHGSAGSRW